MRITFAGGCIAALAVAWHLVVVYGASADATVAASAGRSGPGEQVSASCFRAAALPLPVPAVGRLWECPRERRETSDADRWSIVGARASRRRCLPCLRRSLGVTPCVRSACISSKAVPMAKAMRARKLVYRGVQLAGDV
ncbi:hypothetical protein HPB50_026436 [Hyalomma asiaticum]|uniref:Uncharacterized protein n=1 Tax=Hyalomma asiaticum TaxID=266040 RepID=A0ACB7SES4_HYAAI|nr:hypothetical protein HPB50_026436 [Hyalomma asiaticum]